MSFCRITGRARSLPKPNFFPIIPPISPGDARRLCRITGRRMDRHNYVPLIEYGKRPETLKCSVTQGAKNVPKRGEHKFRQDYKYVTPILKKESLTDAADIKAFEDLQKVLKRLKKNILENDDKMFVYMSSASLCGLILPAEVEEAIKLGEIENISVSKNCDKVMFKIRGKPTLFVNLKEVDSKNNNIGDSPIFNGGGQSKETLSKQKKVLDEKKRKKNKLLNKKIFEDLEKKADDDMDKMEIKPSGKEKNDIWSWKIQKKSKTI
ncbi:unnamed protein product [Lepeophtheirus salmonis]|uniref:(salmon louse) hypothetical protein n=1 Tax=Lepeophtheirus salmonis TaxID=72036 RepID=A0A7R8CSZ8_LEPSM|nr:unnamed protein product [Lepeophtheirus salmonis]CAF2885873.1 unnamed protein product [Lepeophtheirus salmonis]